MKNIIISLILALIVHSSIAQEMRRDYKATRSYDMSLFNKVTEKETGKIFQNLQVRARVYYDESNEFVIIEQLEANTNKPLELNIIDFKNGSQIRLLDKSGKTATIRSFTKPEIPSYMMKDYDLKRGETKDINGFKVQTAKYLVQDQFPEQAQLEITTSLTAPSYFNWMPILQDDLEGQFPLKMKYNREGQGGMITETLIETSEFRNENPFNFATIELKFPDNR